MKKILILCSCVLLTICPVFAQEHIFPAPSEMTLKEGNFTLSTDIEVIGKGKYAQKLAKLLQNDLSQRNLPTIVGKPQIVLSLDKKAKLEPEAYRIAITPEKISLTATQEAGLYHATMALFQMMRAEEGKLRCCELESRPRYEWRGFMLDESRHFMGKEKVKQYLDLMATLHLNVFHWHLTDAPGWRIEIKRYPKLTTEGAIGNWHDPQAPATFYTQEEIKDIVAYAAERQIMVVPEFDMPGHATAICRSYPEISGGGTGKWANFTFHPCKEETFEMIGNIFDELFELFPAPYIHIGADEVHFGNQSWYTDPLIQQYIKEHNLKDEVGMEQDFIRRIADIVAKKGRTIIAWDEAVEAKVDPDKMIVMWWRHDRKKKLTTALERGYRVILSPRRPLYADFLQDESHRYGRRWRDGICTLQDVYAFPAPYETLYEGHESQILGMQMNLWTERIPDTRRADFMTFPRLIAAAEAGWSTAKNYEDFLHRLPKFLEYLNTLGVYYFDPFHPEQTPEPGYPEKLEEMKIGDE